MITIPTVLENVSTRKDGTVRLTFGTSEVSPGTMTDLFRHHNSYCYLAIKGEDFKPIEIENLSKIKCDLDDKRKSSSTRLRGVFYRMYEQDPEGFNTFTTYYESKMETVIEHFKTKLQ